MKKSESQISNHYEKRESEALTALPKPLTTSTRKFGLVWEDKLEEVAEQCETKLPVLSEVVERHIERQQTEDSRRKNGDTLLPDDGSNLPTHLVIEGDNYLALSVLNYTHTGKINVIYIDPPYNTGNSDFIYNDRYVDKEDTYRHSKWLSFMEKRLVLAKNLLAESGVIFISIDDNELAHLRLLCDDVFGEENRIASLPVVMNLKGNNDEFGFAGTHEYALVYGKNKSMTTINEFDIDEEDVIAEWKEDDYGFYKKGATLKATGEDAFRENRPKMFYPILVDKKTNEVGTIKDGEYNEIYKNKLFNDAFVGELKTKYEKAGFYFILPKDERGHFTRWRWGWNNETKIKITTDILVLNGKNGISLYKKQRPELGDLPTKKPKSFFYKPEYSSGNGTALIKCMFGEKIFNNPKPLELIKDFLRLGGKNSATILDFFAGSGTTGHAVLELNAMDGGHRQFILCTNNENCIAENVTYPRIKKVIEGYGGRKDGSQQTADGGKKVEGIPAEVRYFRTEFVEKDENEITDAVRYELVERATDMLKIRENTFTLVVQKEKQGRRRFEIYTNVAKTKYTAVIYDTTSIEAAKQSIVDTVDGLPVSIYIFTLGDDTYESDFDAPNWNVEPLPERILQVYKRLFEKQKNIRRKT